MTSSSCQSIGDGDVPGETFAFFPGDLGHTIGTFTVRAQQACRLLFSRDAGLNNSSPNDIIDELVPGDPARRLLAQKTMQATSIDQCAARTSVRITHIGSQTKAHTDPYGFII